MNMTRVLGKIPREAHLEYKIYLQEEYWAWGWGWGGNQDTLGKQSKAEDKVEL